MMRKLNSNSIQISDKLHVLFKKNNLSALQVAQALNMPVMTIRRLLSGETIDPRISTLKLVANHFGVSIDSLLDDDSSSVIQMPNKAKLHFVPILEWDTIEKIDKISHIELSDCKRWQPISLDNNNNIGSHAFALESRPSMYPRFPQGAIFIFDPDILPEDGDTVLVKIKKANQLTVRDLFIDPPEWQLHPVVVGSKMLHYNHNEFTIIAVNVLTILYNRKEVGDKEKVYL